MNYIKNNKWLIVLLLIQIVALGIAWCLQLFAGLEPCSLCLLQRFGLYISSSIIILFLIINTFRYSKIVNIIMNIISSAGIIFSLSAGLRQTYIQLLPADKIPSCGADLNTLLQVVPVLEAVKKVFQGSGECAEKAIVFLNLSLANWATILFIVLILLQAKILIQTVKK